MKRIFGIFITIMLVSAIAAAQSAPSSVTISWLGHSTFVMNTGTGLKVLLDPTNPGTYNPAPVDGIEVVTVSHEHGDHNYIELATGSPLIIRGLTQNDVAKIDQTIKGVRIHTVASYHDTEMGAQRGRNALFIFEMPGLRIAHLGDLGHKLTDQQVSAIGPVDILMTPVAGGPTIDPKTAVEVIDQLQAKVVIPMHYATPALLAKWNSGGGANRPSGPAGAPGQGGAAGRPRGNFMIAGVDEFLKVLDPSVKVEHVGHMFTLTSDKLPSARTVYVMEYE